jgi:preprotein translocase subunit YajC
MFDQIAYAMGAPGQGGQQGLGMFVPLILLFGIFYFLLIRPQQKRQKDHKALLANLRKGDQVITAGGMYGKITGLTDTAVTLEIAEKVRVKVARGQISTKLLPQSDRPK